MSTLPKFILLFCLIAASAHAITMKEAPKGMYIFSSGFLLATNQAFTSAGTAISNANCDGVRWKLRWSDVEATPDTYTWQYVDDAVALAAANNKKCGISINAGKDCRSMRLLTTRSPILCRTHLEPSAARFLFLATPYS